MARSGHYNWKRNADLRARAACPVMERAETGELLPCADCEALTDAQLIRLSVHGRCGNCIVEARRVQR